MSIVLWEKKRHGCGSHHEQQENRMNLDYASAMIQALNEILEDKGVFFSGDAARCGRKRTGPRGLTSSGVMNAKRLTI